MRNIDQELIDKLSSKEYRTALFIEASIAGSSLKFTNWSAPLELGGSLYWPRGFTVGSLGYGSTNIANGCSVSMEDIDRTFYSLLGANASDDWDVTLKLAILNSLGLVISNGFTTMFKGFVTEWVYSSGKTTIKLKSAFAKWARKTTRMFSTSCTVKVFKSDQCGYVGSETRCDRTYSQCSGYGNESNFQGFRWLEDLASRRIDIAGTSSPSDLPVHYNTPFVGERR